MSSPNAIPEAPWRERAAWCLYDFANSTFTTIIVTAFYVLYFRKVVVGGDTGDGDRLWGYNLAASALVVGVLGPTLGAIADAGGLKKRMLFAFSGLCIVSTAMLYFVEAGDVLVGMILFVAGNVGFEGGIVFYNAFLPYLAPPDRLGRLSGYGWAVGYVGGMLCLAAVIPLVSGGFAAENLDNCRLVFLIVAGFFAVAALPAAIWLREPPVAGPKPASYVREGFARLAATYAKVKEHRNLARFLIAYLAYNDAMVTVIGFSAAFAASTLHFEVKENMQLLILSNITGAIGAIFFGIIADKIGGKRAVIITLVIWLAVIGATLFVSTKGPFWIIASVAGLVLGATQSSSRSLLAQIAPMDHMAEFCGFMALAGRVSAVIGPLLFGEVSHATGSQRLALLSVGAFLAVGLGLLTRVEDPLTARLRAARGARHS